MNGGKRKPSEWNLFVKKVYREGKAKNPKYKFKDALVAASKRKGEMGTKKMKPDMKKAPTRRRKASMAGGSSRSRSASMAGGRRSSMAGGKSRSRSASMA